MSFKLPNTLSLALILLVLPQIPLFDQTLSAQDAPSPNRTSDGVEWLTGGVPRYQENDHALISRELLLTPARTSLGLSSSFFPAEGERKSGNAVTVLLRCHHENFAGMQAVRNLRQADWMEKPLEELQKNKIEPTFLRIDELRRAAFMKRAEWDYPIHEKGFIEILLPDVQESRSTIEALAVVARLAIKEGRLEEAEDRICIAMGISQHLAVSPMIICHLVADANANTGLFAIEELIQSPEARNYYWDLTSLPRPYINHRDAIAWELDYFEKSFQEFFRFDGLKEGKSPETWIKLFETACDHLDYFSSDIPKRNSLEFKEMIDAWKKQARERLPKYSSIYASLDGMSDEEVAIRYWALKSLNNAKRIAASLTLAPHHAFPLADQTMKQVLTECKDEPYIRSSINQLATSSYLIANCSVTQRIDMLRIIEGIRDWTSANPGKLPKSLDELDQAVPLDVSTQRPYRYTLSEDGTTFSLRSNVYPAGTSKPRVLEYIGKFR